MSSPISPSSPVRPPNNRLNGWKEIAAHFGRGVRTVQRWEKALGMPVYRIGTGRGENVHAYTAELDAWLVTVRNSADLSDPPGAAEPETVNRMGGGPARGKKFGRRFLGPRGAVALLAAAIGCVALAVWYRMPAAQPASVKMDVDTLKVYDSENRLLWSHRFKFPQLPLAEGTLTDGPSYVLEDLDGDGAREVALFLTSAGDGWREQLMVFDQNGRPRGARGVTKSVRFGNKTYGPPWHGYRLLARTINGKRMLFAVWVHIQTGEFPCLLERVSANGSSDSEYWSAGYVSTLQAVTVKGVPSVAVGAANNDHKGASLVVFPGDTPQGSAPAENEDKTCRGCPAGGPSQMVVFPRAEMMERAGGFPPVLDIRQQSSGEIKIWLNQVAADQSGRPPDGTVFYTFNAALTPLSAGVDDNYRALHRGWEAAGIVDHPFGEKDLAQLWPILVREGARFVPVTAATER